MLNKYLAGVIISSFALYGTVTFAGMNKSSQYQYDQYGYAQAYAKKASWDSKLPGNKSKVKKYSISYREPSSRISGGNMIKVDLGSLTWAAYDQGGNLVKSGHVSGGKAYCPDIHRRCRTVTGTFTIYSKRGADCKSTRFPVGKGGAKMPYCMFFHGGYALHGSYSVPDYNASHGCVRMAPSDAQWLNQNFVRVGRTRVNITY